MVHTQIAFEFIAGCRGATDPEALLAKIADCAESFGFSHFILAGVSSKERFERQVVLNRWPGDWYERFTRRGYFPVDGVGQWVMRTSRAFTYGEVPGALRLPEQARRVRAEAAAFGLADGFVVPIRTAGYRQWGFSFSCATRCDLGPHDRAALNLIALYAAGCLASAFDHVPHPSKLTAREREVLAWTAAGKSAWETSVILSLSERTVTKHLEHIRAKLNAATAAHAVAEGLRSGELVL